MTWIMNIGNAIMSALQSVRKPLQSIPPILLLCEILGRPGMSAINMTGNIISKLQANDIPTGTTDCGIDNMDNRFAQIIAEEAVKHIKMYGKAENVINPAGLSFIGVGANAGGPLTVTMYNTNYAQFGGVPE